MKHKEDTSYSAVKRNKIKLQEKSDSVVSLLLQRWSETSESLFSSNFILFCFTGDKNLSFFCSNFILFRFCFNFFLPSFLVIFPETYYIKYHIFGTNWQKFVMVLVYRQKWYFQPLNFYPCRTIFVCLDIIFCK